VVIFKKSHRLRAIDPLAKLQDLRERLVVDQFAAARSSEANSLVEAQEMRRGIGVNARAGGLQHCAQKRQVEPFPLVPAT